MDLAIWVIFLIDSGLYQETALRKAKLTNLRKRRVLTEGPKVRKDLIDHVTAERPSGEEGRERWH